MGFLMEALYLPFDIAHGGICFISLIIIFIAELSVLFDLFDPFELMAYFLYS